MIYDNVYTYIHMYIIYIYIYLSYCIIKTCVNLNGSFVLNCLAPRGPRAWRGQHLETSLGQRIGAGWPWASHRRVGPDAGRLGAQSGPDVGSGAPRNAMFEIPWSLDIHRRHGQNMFPFQIFSNMTSIHWKGLGVSVLTLKGFETKLWIPFDLGRFTLISTMESSGDGGDDMSMWLSMPQEDFAEDCAAEAAFAECLDPLPWFGCRACPMSLDVRGKWWEDDEQ